MNKKYSHPLYGWLFCFRCFKGILILAEVLVLLCFTDFLNLHMLIIYM